MPYTQDMIPIAFAVEGNSSSPCVATLSGGSAWLILESISGGAMEVAGFLATTVVLVSSLAMTALDLQQQGRG